MEDQGKVEGFLNNVKNADKLAGLVENIRDAMMHYQVCIYGLFVSNISDVRTRLHYNKVSTIRAVNSL